MWAMFSSDMQKEVDEYSTLKKVFIRVVTLTLGLGIILSALTCDASSRFLTVHQEHYLLIYSSIALFFIYAGVLVTSYIFANMYNHTRKIIFEVSSERPRWEWLEKEYNESDMRALYITVKRLHEAVSEQSRMHGIAEIAARVAHDLRSPLASLSMAIDGIENIPEARSRLIQNSSQRINDIANDLLRNYRKNPWQEREPMLGDISRLLKGLIEEKKIQHQLASVDFKTQFHPMTDCVFLKVQKTEFISMMSNLIDNSVEAIASQSSGYVSVTTSLVNEWLEITISDNGSGISPLHLEEIKNGNYSTKKENGNGLGLKNAINCARNKWKGEFDIQSVVGSGTVMKFRLKVYYS